MKGSQYNYFLDVSQAAEGIHIALENAQSLLDDAILLNENGRHARAVALAILSIEESGKPSIIRSILLEQDKKAVGQRWNDYRQHKSKSQMWILPELVVKGARRLEDLRDMFTSNTHTQLLEDLKQRALYTDAYKRCKWSSPDQIMDKEIADIIIEAAAALVRKENPIMTTVAELSVWVKHLKPVWNQEMSEMNLALYQCYRELEECGLAKEGKAEDMRQFLNLPG